MDKESPETSGVALNEATPPTGTIKEVAAANPPLQNNSAEQIRCNYPDLFNWLMDIFHTAQEIDYGVKMIGEESSPNSGLGIHLEFYTHHHTYLIDAHLVYGEDPGYLGCTARTRKCVAGEDWQRGKDLADGPYCRSTWQWILNDIVTFESVPLGSQ